MSKRFRGKRLALNRTVGDGAAMERLPRIDSEASLKDWLEGRPPRDAAIIAHRAAMRVLPVWVEQMKEPWARKLDLGSRPIDFRRSA